MAYLATFYWGWLLASLLLGLAMGWISIVQHGEGISTNGKRWLALLAVQVRHHDAAEVLNDDLNLLGDVVWVQAQEAGDGTAG